MAGQVCSPGRVKVGAGRSRSGELRQRSCLRASLRIVKLEKLWF
jgi:hypothetical protein